MSQRGFGSSFCPGGLTVVPPPFIHKHHKYFLNCQSDYVSLLGIFKVSSCLQGSYKDLSPTLKDLRPTFPATTSVPSSHYSNAATPQTMFQLSRFSRLAGLFLDCAFVGCSFCIWCMPPVSLPGKIKLHLVRFTRDVIVLVKPRLLTPRN